MENKLNIIYNAFPNVNENDIYNIVQFWEQINQEKTTDKKNMLFASVNIEDVNENEKEYFLIAKAFYELIKFNLTNLGTSTKTLEKSKYKKFVDPIRLMMQVDEVTKDELKEVFKFLKGHEFWSANIQSTEKLRKQFTTLHSQSKTKSNGRQKSVNAISDDYKRSLFNRLNS